MWFVRILWLYTWCNKQYISLCSKQRGFCSVENCVPSLFLNFDNYACEKTNTSVHYAGSPKPHDVVESFNWRPDGRGCEQLKTCCFLSFHIVAFISHGIQLCVELELRRRVFWNGDRERKVEGEEVKWKER